MLKPKLLALELWGVGDLIIASTFLRHASEQYDVTLLSKPFALELRTRICPAINVISVNAPWTAFSHKYRLLSWPWGNILGMLRQLRRSRFDVAVSARWDPRDHFLLAVSGAKRRLGFPRMGSQLFLTDALSLPGPQEHRYEYWRTIGQTLGLKMPPYEHVELSPRHHGKVVLVHTGAGQPVRVWPLERYRSLVQRLRAKNYSVRVLCNPEQRAWWLDAGESAVATPETITELLDMMTDAGAFIGNDSGPGHLAAFLGIPTFTLFGPQVPNWFVPLHPSAVYLEGKACPYKPCADYCRFTVPRCLAKLEETDVWPRLDQFLEREMPVVSHAAAAV